MFERSRTFTDCCKGCLPSVFFFFFSISFRVFGFHSSVLHKNIPDCLTVVFYDRPSLPRLSTASQSTSFPLTRHKQVRTLFPPPGFVRFATSFCVCGCGCVCGRERERSSHRGNPNTLCRGRLSFSLCRYSTSPATSPKSPSNVV